MVIEALNSKILHGVLVRQKGINPMVIKRLAQEHIPPLGHYLVRFPIILSENV
jgi:hypothetical protein